DLTCDHSVTYYPGRARGRRPRVPGPRRSDAKAAPRLALRARRPHAHGARVAARDDPLRRHEAPADPRGGGARRLTPGRTDPFALLEPGAHPADPRPLDRQVQGAPRVCPRGAQDATGGDGMTTITEVQTTQVYQVFIKATPEAIWDAITKPEFTR